MGKEYNLFARKHMYENNYSKYKHNGRMFIFVTSLALGECVLRRFTCVILMFRLCFSIQFVLVCTDRDGIYMTCLQSGALKCVSKA